jgi:uncharacterized membrane protein YccC
MEQSKVARLSKLLAMAEECITQLHADGFLHTAFLFEMARLDLQTRLHDISEQELKDLCTVIENRDARRKTRAHPRSFVDEATGARRSSARRRLKSSESAVTTVPKDNRQA